jgi:hypothetical protein
VLLVVPRSRRRSAGHGPLCCVRHVRPPPP